MEVHLLLLVTLARAFSTELLVLFDLQPDGPGYYFVRSLGIDFMNVIWSSGLSMPSDVARLVMEMRKLSHDVRV